MNHKNKIYARLKSSDWGIWGREKYTFDDNKLDIKHQKEIALLQKLIEVIPERMKLALRYSYGICDLDAMSLPITEKEYYYLSGIYNEAEIYTSHINDEGFRFLLKELYYIHKTASQIPGFINGKLVNETNNPDTWRSYIYLDFFKFSCINILIRDKLEDINEYSDELLTSKFILSYFLGNGLFTEKVSILFSTDSFIEIKKFTKEICKKIELFPEFPDIQYQNYYNDYLKILSYIREFRKGISPKLIIDFYNKRYHPFDVCNQYYSKYYSFSPTSERYYNKPLSSLIRLYRSIKDNKSLNINDTFISLKTIMMQIDEKYFNDSLLIDDLTINNFYTSTTHPYFQALLYEGKILGILYQAENPDSGRFYNSLFSELVPFYSLSIKKKKKLFTFDTKVSNDLPYIALAHHVHNANCEKLYDKMVINKLMVWDSEKLFFLISSSSSKLDVVFKERENCLDLGYTYYRIHARQHLKAGNQNRAIPNAIDGVGKEYYLTLDDDYFVFPDFALIGHTEITEKNLDYYQAPLAFRGVYDFVTHAEKVDAESMLFFESTYGRNYPRNYVFPRGTGTIFHFTNGQSSLTDTGGFLVDFSCEDFGQGYISLIQQNTNFFGKIRNPHFHGQMSEKIHVIGEGVDLNGKVKQIDRWMQGAGKIFFHLLIPVLVKCIIKGETRLLLNKQFISTFCLTASGITFRFMLFSILCLPFLYSFIFSYHYLIPGIVNIPLILLVILVNFSSIFIMFFYIQGKINFLSAIRLVLIESVITVPAIHGYLKGLLGFNPKIWSANKSRRILPSSYTGVYILIFMNIFPLITLNNLGFWLYFWAIFNLFFIAFGLILFKKYYRPRDIHTRIVIKPKYILWIIIFLISIFLNIWFFIAEINATSNLIKFAILSLMLFNFYISTRMLLLNLVLVYKQERYKFNK